jgi:VanZ family protein
MFFHGIFLPWVRSAGLWLFWPALAVVTWGELTPHPPTIEIGQWDKAQHFTAYFGLALLATLGWGLRRSLWVVFLAVVLLGGGLEVLQGLLGRDAAWLDQLANTLGALAGTGTAIGYLAMPRRPIDKSEH